MKRTLFILLILLGFGIQISYAQSARSMPGYVDLSRLGDLQAVIGSEPTIEVNVEGALLRLVAEASRAEDPDLAVMLRRLDGIYVRGFAMKPGVPARARDRARVIGAALEKDGWTTIVRINDEEEYVRMYALMDRDQIVGMVVMAIEADSDEAIFLNIVGDVDPEEIGRIGSRFRVHIGG